MNWKKIATFAAVLFVAELLLGFIDGGRKGGGIQTEVAEFGLTTLFSLLVGTVVFATMAFRQEHRPFLHASLALLGMTVFSVSLALLVPNFLGRLYMVFAVIETLVLVGALIVGTLAGRHIGGRDHADLTDV